MLCWYSLHLDYNVTQLHVAKSTDFNVTRLPAVRRPRPCVRSDVISSYSSFFLSSPRHDSSAVRRRINKRLTSKNRIYSRDTRKFVHFSILRRIASQLRKSVVKLSLQCYFNGTHFWPVLSCQSSYRHAVFSIKHILERQNLFWQFFSGPAFTSGSGGIFGIIWSAAFWTYLSKYFNQTFSIGLILPSANFFMLKTFS